MFALMKEDIAKVGPLLLQVALIIGVIVIMF